MADGKICGFFYSPLDKEAYEAHGFEDFVLKADHLFDKYGYPQAYVTGRSFQEEQPDENHYRGMPKAVRTVEEILSFRGEYATCDIVVESRKNATWQGIVGDGHGRMIGRFECVLDITKIIREYLGE
ncbi:MAG: hypothetical protein IJZ82_00430 [Lachnospiraceae bacterium]|nr:hypothetical protein [Lachnospiraceae bacterium]